MSEFSDFTRSSVQSPIDLRVQREMLSIQMEKAAISLLEELGTSCRGTADNDDEEVHGGGTPYETIEEYNEIIGLGDSLSRISWGTNAKDNRAYYIVDTGHTINVKPKDDKAENKDSVSRVEKVLENWAKENSWSERQSEVSHRLDRHGEEWDILYYDPDEPGLLRLSFAEPADLGDDADSKYLFQEDSKLEYEDYMGVRRTNNVLYRPVAYFIDDNWYDDLAFRLRGTQLAAIPDSRILVQHRKRNVLSTEPRGMHLYWPVREELTWAKKLLSNLMRVSGFQAAFGAIRTISEMHSADAVKSYLGSLQGGQAGAGEDEKFNFPAAAVVTVPRSVKYEFPETGAGNSNHIEVLVNLLRACASGMKLPEFMLTANVSEGNFASTLVSEGPFHKGMRYEQGLMVKEDLRILYQALRYAADHGIEGLSHADIDAVMLEVKPPRVQTRNRKEDFEVNQKLWEDGLLSGKSLLASEDREHESEYQQIQMEREAELPPPLAVTGLPTVTGPEPGLKSDPLKEKGVSAGEPPETPES